MSQAINRLPTRGNEIDRDNSKVWTEVYSSRIRLAKPHQHRSNDGSDGIRSASEVDRGRTTMASEA